VSELFDIGQMVLRLGLALLLGGALGLEREIRGKEAGLRTHILVAVGSGLIVLISVSMAEEFGPSGVADPTRVAAGVITGIGFLGAGTIIRSEEGVKGLTTAASLWVASAVGMAVGGGFYAAGLIATFLGIACLMFLHGMEGLLHGYETHSVVVSAKAAPEFADRLSDLFAELGFRVSRRGGHLDAGSGEMTASFSLKGRTGHIGMDCLDRLRELPEVTRVDWR